MREDPLKNGADSSEKPDAVLQVLAHPLGSTDFFTREPDGKFRAPAKAWNEKQLFSPDQVLEVRMVGGRLKISRKTKRPDAGDEFQSIGAGGQIAAFC